MTHGMIEVRENDGSLVGYVKQVEGYWVAYNAEGRILPGLSDTHLLAAVDVYERASRLKFGDVVRFTDEAIERSIADGDDAETTNLYRREFAVMVDEVPARGMVYIQTDGQRLWGVIRSDVEKVTDDTPARA